MGLEDYNEDDSEYMNSERERMFNEKFHPEEDYDEEKWNLEYENIFGKFIEEWNDRDDFDDCLTPREKAKVSELEINLLIPEIEKCPLLKVAEGCLYFTYCAGKAQEVKEFLTNVVPVGESTRPTRNSVEIIARTYPNELLEKCSTSSSYNECPFYVDSLKK